MTHQAQLRALAQSIRLFRKNAGLTISELAELAEIDAGFLASIETNKKGASLETLFKLARVLGQPVSSFFGDPPERDGNPKHRLDMRIRSLCASRSPAEQEDLIVLLRRLTPEKARALRRLIGR